MTSNSSGDTSHPDGPPEHRIGVWTRQWNKLRSPINSERAPPGPLTHEQQLHLERLLPLVADDLRRLASTPKHRWLGDSSQDRVYELFICLIQGLTRRRDLIDPDGNVPALLVKIADGRASDRLRQEARHSRRRAALSDDQEAPSASDVEETTAALDYEAAVLKATWAFWDTLQWPEREIMRLRHETGSQHPRPFASIAAHLGPRHKTNTVQVTYRRTLERTREHLRRLGLLD